MDAKTLSMLGLLASAAVLWLAPSPSALWSKVKGWFSGATVIGGDLGPSDEKPPEGTAAFLAELQKRCKGAAPEQLIEWLEASKSYAEAQTAYIDYLRENKTS